MLGLLGLQPGVELLQSWHGQFLAQGQTKG